MDVVRKFKTKQITVNAIQFTGKNGKLIAAYLRDKARVPYVRNRGRRVDFSNHEKNKDGSFDGLLLKLHKGDWMVDDNDGYVTTYDHDEFVKSFVIPKNFVFSV